MREFILCIFLVSAILSGYAQEQKETVKKVFRAENGKIYVQKTLPVYLWLSVSPDSLNEKVLLTSQTTPEFANPMYFDADGFNSIRVKGQVDHKTKQLVNADEETVFEVYGDSKPPESYIIVQSNFIKFEEGMRVYNNECVLDILSYDMFSDVGQIYFSVNGEPFQEYTEQITISSAGIINLKYYAVDNVGNKEELKELSFKIEK